MCGIAGFVTASRHHQAEAGKRLEGMLDTLQHRGPDDRGKYIDAHAALGHDRLAIIDLSACGHQPMCNEDGSIQVIFNGEIYNFRELRTRLVAAGHSFTSQTDTEVLVHGYEAWGLTGLLERIEGMFAFAIWDANKQQLFLARDQFGIKPLYYLQRETTLAFASEPKALAAWDDRATEIDNAGLLMSFQHIGIPDPYTIYAGYRQLEPGMWLAFGVADTELQFQRYWSWNAEPEIGNAREAAGLLWDSICESVEKQLIADVPVGIFLSGGLDSSLLVAACAELGRDITALTIALPDSSQDESPYAAAVCKHFGVDHWVETMDAAAALPFDARLATMFDEPFASSAALSAAYISELASRRFKVMLSGEGGDELFGGYRWYRSWIKWYGNTGQQVPLWQRPRNAIRALTGRSYRPADPMEGYAGLMGGFSKRQMRGLFNAELLSAYPVAADAGAFYDSIDNPSLQGFDRLQSLDMQLFLPAVCLRKMDRTSMASSLEVRVPLLDLAVARVATRIDAQVRNPNYEMKALIKQLARDKLPAAVVNKKKKGFSTPVRHWFSPDNIIKEIQADMAQGTWWKSVFSANADQAVRQLRGRALWRFWHTWRWLKNHGGDEVTATPP